MPTEVKPWGEYTDLFRHQEYVLKTITVAPKQRLSLQTHKDRAEFWVCLSGEPLVEIDDEIKRLLPRQTIEIPRRACHRLINDGVEPVVILELQHGYCNEWDIQRLEDDYDRTLCE